MKKLMIAVVAVFAGASVWAAYGPYDDELPNGSSEAKCFSKENGYVKQTAKDSASGSAYIYSFSANNLDGSLGEKCGKWDEEALAPHSGAKYYVPSSKTVVTSNPQGTPAGNVITFAGDQLVIGNGGTFQSMANGNNSAKVDNLFMLGGSQFYWSGEKKSLQGNAHIRRADQKPVTLSANANLTQRFGMKVDGDADQQIVFTTVKNDTSFRSAIYTIDETSDWTDFHGSILITNDCSVTNYTRVRFDATQLPARVTVAPGCEFKTYGNSVSMVGLTERTETRVAIDDGATWTVGDFVVDADVTLQFEDATARFVVTNSFTINPGCSLTLKLASGGFDMSAGDVPPISLISFGPEVDLTGVTTDTFKYEGIVKSGAPTVTFALEQDEETGLTTLVARRKTVVIRDSKNETTDPMESHFWRAATNANDEACWTDGLAPHPGADYYLAKSATPPKTGSTSEGFTFAGDSLTIKGSSSGVTFVDASSVLAYLDFKDLRIVGDKGEYVMFRTYNDSQPNKTVGGTKLHTWEIRGKTTIADGATLRHSPYGGRLQFMPDEQVGAGTIEVASHNSASKKATNTGRILFGALNTNFTGRVCFKHPYNKKMSGDTVTYEVPDADVHVWLYMTDGRNLGGPLPAFSHNALTVNDWGRLVALDDASDNVVLDQANRGVCVNWVGQFDVPKATTTLTIKNPITLTGNLYKRGAGTLVLASPLRFAENDDVADVGTPRANSNLVTVTEGSVKVTHAHALDGAAVSFAADTKLVIPVDADATSDLAKFGAINVKENGGFSSTAADGKITVGFELPANATAEVTVAICTVPKDSALSADSFAVVRPKGYACSLTSVDNDDDTKTIKATFVPKGLILLVR